jgi:hypothetical protein
MNPSFHINVKPFLRGTAVKRGAIFGAILVAALLAFELFNYSTTAFALADVLGDLQSAGVRWSTVLALAFCGIDFAGIARLFTPQRGRDDPTEVWYLFGAWLLAATFNAVLTWWGVSVAILHHASEGSILIGQAALTRFVPVIVALMVWMIRVLIIGTFSLAGDSMFSMGERRPVERPATRPHSAASNAQPAVSYSRSAPTPIAAARAVGTSVAEPTYHRVGMSAEPYEPRRSVRQ